MKDTCGSFRTGMERRSDEIKKRVADARRNHFYDTLKMSRVGHDTIKWEMG